jgi:hypothetical protein
MPGDGDLSASLAFTGRFAMGALATWRVAHMVAYEDGPFDIIVRLRARAGDSLFGGLMDCIYCLTVWVAVPFTVWVVRGRRNTVPVSIAMSGAACLLERVAGSAADNRGSRPASADRPAA